MISYQNIFLASTQTCCEKANECLLSCLCQCCHYWLFFRLL